MCVEVCQYLSGRPEDSISPETEEKVEKVIQVRSRSRKDYVGEV
jgi:hypothetical protein